MLASGFFDPVHGSQQAFRAILDALARPGTVHTLTGLGAGESSMPAELASVLLTLTDHDTAIWLSPGLGGEDVRQFIGFHTGAVVVSDPEKATFAFVAGEMPLLEAFNLGTQEYPDRSTTLVVQVLSFEGGPELVLRGPGIEDHWHIGPQGLPKDFVAQWSENRSLFPRGIDLLLVSGGKVMGLPRSVRIEEGH